MTVEYASFERRNWPNFPEEWGDPPLEARARYKWIAEHCAGPAAAAAKQRVLEILKRKWGPE